MSKATTIRKKALDLVRDQDWANAIKEYKRLVELDQSNPNVHNELADIYLKTGQKAEAYDAFVRAIDEYTRVGLHNNAVAVCKKVMRMLPARVEVLTKLGFIRARQGLAREAESYYLQFLEKSENSGVDARELARIAVTMAEDMKDSTTVLKILAQSLTAAKLMDEAGDVLVRLYSLQTRLRDSAGATETRALVDKLGLLTRLDAVAATPAGGDAGREGPVITEANIWTSTHSEGERIEVESTPRFTPPQPTAAPAPQPAAAASAGPSERDLYLLRLARGSADPRPKPAPEPSPAAAAPAQAVATEELKPTSDEVEPTTATVANDAEALPASAPSTPSRPSSPSTNGNSAMNISALIDGDNDNDEDFRSHYDLGMAYLEMDLLSEAIREYQIAAKSPQYLVKCLEMIGLCFVKQNQPQLAIRQLTKGLGLIGADSDESLGIKYNLGLAYEMTGDNGNARTYFEDVYVVDVTFRDVAEKIRKLSEV